MIRFLCIFLLLTACPTVVLGQISPSLQKVCDAAGQQVSENEVLKQIVVRDQAIRTASSMKTAQPGAETDEDRRKLVRGIIDRNELHTGLDYANAALVLQHGSSPDDYLLAHTLAVVGTSKGNRLALCLFAATLDRYLQSTKQPQIYGTQFTRKPPGPFELYEINAGLLTDAIRVETDVATAVQQEQQIKDLNKQLTPEPSKP